MKNILHVSFSKSGGAGVVAEMLSNGQNSLDCYQSKFAYEYQSNIKNQFSKNLQLSIRAIVDDKIVKKHSKIGLFSHFRNIESSFFKDLIIDHTGITHLHWINGIINFNSLNTIIKRNKKIVWTIHDMAPYTGGCHHTLECEMHSKNCSDCPIVRFPFKSQVYENQKSKINFFQTNSLSLVFPTNWMLKTFTNIFPSVSSSLSVIPNPIDPVFFQKNHEHFSIRNLGIDPDSFVLGFVSDNLSNPFKRFNLVLEVATELGKLVNKRIVILAIGHGLNVTKNYKNIKIIQTGRVNDKSYLAKLYSAMNINLSLSMAESFGLSVIESAALSVPSLVLAGSGSSELIIDNENGIVARNKREVIDKLIIYVNDNELRNRMSLNSYNFANKNWKLDLILKQYDKVYNDIF